MIDEDRVIEALSTVRDPELDQPITELKFVEGLEVAGESVRVRLRLPTYFCAPNFAYLMAADAKAAVGSVEGVEDVSVSLVDHFASDEINQGLSLGDDFEQTFSGLATGELTDLRDIFTRKAFIARQGRLCSALLERGRTLHELTAMRLEDLPPSPEVETYLERRRELGLDTSPEAPLLLNPAGKPIPEDEVAAHLRFARTVGVSIEANAGLCRSLLATRYGIPDPEEATP
jgi:metal-sulfur cluster biosynthetic enzyme